MVVIQKLLGFGELRMTKQDSEFGSATAMGDASANAGAVAPEDQGLKGEYDPSGLSKRVALAFDEDTALKGLDTVYVSQNDSVVILNGSVVDVEILNRLIAVASAVEGVTEVDSHAVIVQSR